MTNAIEMHGVTRFYGEKRGVQNLDLTVPKGAVVGLLGENGSGKTTAMKIAMGALFPDTGSVCTLGEDPTRMEPQTRARIAWLTDVYALPQHMRLKDAMAIQAAYFPTWNNKVALKLAHQFDLTSTTVFGELSLGQRRRFALVLVLAQMPELLVMDEPAGGLDTTVRRQVIDLLLTQVAERSITIVLSSHILSDVERLVDVVAFMKEGTVSFQGNLESMRQRVKRLCTFSTSNLDVIRERFTLISEDRSGEVHRVVVSDFEPDRLAGIETTVEHLNLEELFLAYNAVQGQISREQAELW